ncbi:MAG TPA: NADH:flavin oxidoreductase/NADH oxidase family protein [Kofleriaceae bacterium]|nr:NADH:flavin oxidoreductase/NADH oxidase family protein [Kofleriaceae bacterium]
MNHTPSLGSPLTLRSGSVLPNRIAKAAMSEVLADLDTHAPTDALVRLYERWGKSGAGLLITGHVIVDRSGLGEPGNVVVEDDRHLAMLRRWAEAGQAHGARMFMQLNHAGRQAPKNTTRQPVAPSAIALGKRLGRLFAPPRALSEPEIELLIQRFAKAAAVAKAAGFAGVELHGAHGYLISQFLSPRANQRDDAWGGDAARRRHFLLEIVRAVRRAVGPAFPIAVKLNSADFQRGGFTIEEAMDVARALETAGIDLLEVSGGNYESPAMAGSGELPAQQRQSSREREAYFLEYARQIRGVTALPLMLTGGMRSRAVMDDVLASGAVDVIGIARPLTYVPDLPRRLLDGTLDAAPPVRIRSRIKLLDDALQVMWFAAQIHELAAGREPNLRLGTWRALWHGIRANVLDRTAQHDGTLPVVPAVVGHAS